MSYHLAYLHSDVNLLKTAKCSPTEPYYIVPGLKRTEQDKRGIGGVGQKKPSSVGKIF